MRVLYAIAFSTFVLSALTIVGCAIWFIWACRWVAEFPEAPYPLARVFWTAAVVMGCSATTCAWCAEDSRP